LLVASAISRADVSPVRSSCRLILPATRPPSLPRHRPRGTLRGARDPATPTTLIPHDTIR